MREAKIYGDLMKTVRIIRYLRTDMTVQKMLPAAVTEILWRIKTETGGAYILRRGRMMSGIHIWGGKDVYKRQVHMAVNIAMRPL